MQKQGNARWERTYADDNKTRRSYLGNNPAHQSRVCGWVDLSTDGRYTIPQHHHVSHDATKGSPHRHTVYLTTVHVCVCVWQCGCASLLCQWPSHRGMMRQTRRLTWIGVGEATREATWELTADVAVAVLSATSIIVSPLAVSPPCVAVPPGVQDNTHGMCPSV